MGTLFVVSTPIGNLDDITLRAIKILLSVDAVLCEDTRRTGILMKHLSNVSDISIYQTQNQSGKGYRGKLISYYEQNEFRRIPEVLNALKNGLTIALVSDAGTPLISDPGFKLVRECIKEGIKVEAIPGASSILSALVASGLPTDKFLFLGYPPKKPGHRISLFDITKQSLMLSEKFHPTVVLFEAPHRLIQLLSELYEVFGDIEVVLARELTKIHEEFQKKRLSEFQKQFQEHAPKGEYVVLLNLDDQNS